MIWIYAVSDGAIALAYFTIPAALAVLARRRRDLIFRPLFWLFATFILLCGATHLLDVLTLWVPAYGLEGVTKAATAAASLMSSITLWRLLPEALSLPSHNPMREANRALRESEVRARESFEHSPAPPELMVKEHSPASQTAGFLFWAIGASRCSGATLASSPPRALQRGLMVTQIASGARDP